MKYLRLLLLLFALIAQSCIYINGELNYVDIISDYEPEVIIQTNIQSHDSIELLDSLFFKYNIEIDTGKFYFADLLLANVRLMLSDTTSDSLWIYPDMIQLLGDHELTLSAYYKSYTGSLADKMDADFSSFADTTWTITIYAQSVE